jgi:hypothetical protein
MSRAAALALAGVVLVVVWCSGCFLQFGCAPAAEAHALTFEHHREVTPAEAQHAEDRCPH